MNPSYWWKCMSCACARTFAQTLGTNSIHGFLWNTLLPSDWEQELLVRKCPECREFSLRIAYEFPRQRTSVVTVYHIVGADKGNWMPMMWETTLDDESDDHLFDFKYICRKQLFGLNRPAVFSQNDLSELFTLYCARTRKPRFP
jgi:hypothetical protein